MSPSISSHTLRNRTRKTPQNPSPAPISGDTLRNRTLKTLKTSPLRFSLEADGRPPVPVVLRGRTADGVRAVASETGAPLEETFARLLREGLARVTS